LRNLMKGVSLVTSYLFTVLSTFVFIF
jgi:hypothetical protein